MLDIMLFMLNLGWKILGIACGWILLRYILRNGKGTFKDVLETLGSAIKTGCYFIRKKLAEKLLKEKEKENLEAEVDSTKVEAHVV